MTPPDVDNTNCVTPAILRTKTCRLLCGQEEEGKDSFWACISPSPQTLKKTPTEAEASGQWAREMGVWGCHWVMGSKQRATGVSLLRNPHLKGLLSSLFGKGLVC